MQAALRTAPTPFSKSNPMRALEALAQQAAEQAPAQSDNSPDAELSHIVELGYN